MEAAKNRNPFPGVRKGTLKRLFQEEKIEQNIVTPTAPPLSEEENPPDTTPPNPNSLTPTNPLAERIRRSFILKKNKASPKIKQRVVANHKQI